MSIIYRVVNRLLKLRRRPIPPGEYRCSVSRVRIDESGNIIITVNLLERMKATKNPLDKRDE